MLKKGLNSYQLKVLALLFMIIDHIGVFFLGTTIFFRWIGRLSAPIFIFCCVQGINHTRSKENYLLRLYISSIVMSLIQVILKIDLNFLRTLFFLSTILYIIEIGCEKHSLKKYLSIYAIWQIISTILTVVLISNSTCRTEDYLIYFLPAVLGNLYNIEGGLFIIALGIIFYYFKNNLTKLSVSFLAYDIVYAILFLTPIVGVVLGKLRYLFWGSDVVADILSGFIEVIVGIPPWNRGGEPLAINFQWMMIFSLVLILMYNGKKGRSFKWFFYIFYPAHIILIFCISSNF